MKRSVTILTAALCLILPSTVLAVDYSGTMPANDTWDSSAVRRITADFTIPVGVRLTIEAGTIVLFQGTPQNPISFRVDGELDIKGSANNKVLFTTEDSNSANQPNMNPVAGSWSGLVIINNGTSRQGQPLNNEIRGADIRGAQTGIAIRGLGDITDENDFVLMREIHLQNIQGDGIQAVHGNYHFEDISTLNTGDEGIDVRNEGSLRTRAEMKNITVDNPGVDDGIYVRDFAGPLRITNLTVKNTSNTTNGINVVLNTACPTDPGNCVVEIDGADISGVRHGIRINPNSGQTMVSASIKDAVINCRTLDQSRYGIYVDSVTTTDVDGGSVTGCQDGINLNGGNLNVQNKAEFKNLDRDGIHIINGNIIKVDNTTIDNVDRNAIDVGAQTLHVSGKTLISNAASNGIQGVSGMTITFDDSTIDDVGNDGIRLNDGPLTVTNATIRNTNDDAIAMIEGTLIVTDSTFAEIGGTGIQALMANSQPNTGVVVSVRNLTIDGTGQQGIFLTGNASKLTIQQSTIRRYGTSGIFLNINASNTVNLIENCVFHSPKSTNNTTAVAQEQNSVVNVRFSTFDGRGTTSNTHNGIGLYSGSGTLEGNIITQFNGRGLGIANQGFTVRFNVSNGNGSVQTPCNYAQLTGQWPPSCIAKPSNNEDIDPGYRDPANRDFRLSGGSPAYMFTTVDPNSVSGPLDRTSSTVIDRLNNGRVGFWDIGAFETPVVVSVSPDSAMLGTDVTVTISGYNFIDGVTAFGFDLPAGGPDPGITNSNTGPTSPNPDYTINTPGSLQPDQIVVDLTLQAWTTLGSHDVSVSNPGTARNGHTKLDSFTVQVNPQVDAVNPDSITPDVGVDTAVPDTQVDLGTPDAGPLDAVVSDVVIPDGVVIPDSVVVDLVVPDAQQTDSGVVDGLADSLLIDSQPNDQFSPDADSPGDLLSDSTSDDGFGQLDTTLTPDTSGVDTSTAGDRVAGTDQSNPGVDGGVVQTLSGDNSGCSCRIDSSSQQPALMLIVFLLLFGGALMRRRRRGQWM